MNAAQTIPLSQRKLLVTGASRGIGATTCRALLNEGAQVIGIARDFSDWDQQPEGFTPLQWDLSNINSLEGRLKDLLKQHPDIDGLISNAGAGRFGQLEQFSVAQIRQGLDINLTQHLLFARALLPAFKRQGFGDLLFMGSESALQGGPKGALYSACKFALRGLAQSLRQDCAAAGVRVGIVNPGMVDSSFFDQLDFRPGEQAENHIRVEDVAASIIGILNLPPGTVVDEINLSPLKKTIRFGGKDA